MKRLIFLVSIFLLYGQVWGAADTLQPVADQVINWDHTGCSAGSYYQCVDDPPGSPDSDTTYAYTTTANEPEYFLFDSIFVSNIESVVVHVNVRKVGYEDSTVYLYEGFGYYSEGAWHWWTTDSVELAAEWESHSENLDYDPSWTYQEVNARRFGMCSGYATVKIVDTLSVVLDGGVGWCSGWTASGCTDHYECVDDAPGSPDGDATRMYVAGAYVIDCFDLEDATADGAIDSIVLRTNAKRTGDASALSLGFLTGVYTPHWEGAVNLTTDYADYSVLSTEDENSQTWTNAKINDKKWAYGTASGTNNRTVTQFFLMVYYTLNVPIQSTQVFVIVYYPGAEEAVKPSDSIIREDEDTGGILKGGIVR